MLLLCFSLLSGEVVIGIELHQSDRIKRVQRFSHTTESELFTTTQIVLFVYCSYVIESSILIYSV